MFNKLRVWNHKRHARRHYMAEINLLNKYNCGVNMINTLTGGEITRHQNGLRKHVARAKKLEAAPRASKTEIFSNLLDIADVGSLLWLLARGIGRGIAWVFKALAKHGDDVI